MSIVFLDSVSFIPEYWLETAKQKNIPKMFISFSEIRHKLLKDLTQNYKDITAQKTGNWTIVSATRFR